jgi:cell pole-organizing protein PopZ
MYAGTSASGDKVMNDAKATQEPSMEEILASIRRIISEEGNADDASEKKAEAPIAPPSPVSAAPAAPLPPAEEEEELVLTDEVRDELQDLQEEPLPVAEPKPAVEKEIELAQPEPPSPPPQPPQRPAPQIAEPTEHVAGPGVGEAPLVSPDVAEASASAMAQLIARRAQTVVEVQSPGQGLLVETLVRQAVEPMLRDWLDANLQGIVERLVRREVERIARRAELS